MEIYVVYFNCIIYDVLIFSNLYSKNKFSFNNFGILRVNGNIFYITYNQSDRIS